MPKQNSSLALNETLCADVLIMEMCDALSWSELQTMNDNLSMGLHKHIYQHYIISQMQYHQRKLLTVKICQNSQVIKSVMTHQNYRKSNK